MSNVTNIILITSVLETRQTFEYINFFIKGQSNGYRLFDKTNSAGGDKHMECRVYMGAFNYFDLKAFRHFLSYQPWEDFESVQCLVKGQEDDVFYDLLRTNPKDL